MCTSCSVPPKTITHENARTHACINNSHYSAAQYLRPQEGSRRKPPGEYSCNIHCGMFSEALTSILNISRLSVCEQSQTTQEIVASVSELSRSQVRSDQRPLRSERGRGGGRGGRARGLSGPNYIQSWEIGKVQSEGDLHDESRRPDELRWSADVSDFTEKTGK